MPSSIFDPNYNPFTVDPGGDVSSGLSKLHAVLKRKKEKLEEEEKKRKELEKRIPGGFDNA
jgi:hypothetical protein